MATVTVINPSAIKEGSVQEVKADLSKFDFAKSQVALVENELKSFSVITSEKMVSDALEAAKTANLVDKAIEEKRKALVKPFNTAVSEINGKAKELSAPITNGISTVKDAVLKFQHEEAKRKLQARNTQRQAQLVQLGFTYNPTVERFECEGIGGTVNNTELERYDDGSWTAVIDSFVNAISKRNSDAVASLSEDRELTSSFGSEEDVAVIDQKIAQASAPVTVAPVTAPTQAFAAKGTTKRWVHEITDATQIPREYLQVNETAIRQAITAGVREIPGVRIFQNESISLR